MILQCNDCMSSSTKRVPVWGFRNIFSSESTITHIQYVTDKVVYLSKIQMSSKTIGYEIWLLIWQDSCYLLYILNFTIIIGIFRFISLQLRSTVNTLIGRDWKFSWIWQSDLYRKNPIVGLANWIYNEYFRVTFGCSLYIQILSTVHFSS